MDKTMILDVFAGVLTGFRDAIVGMGAITKLDSRWLENDDTISSRMAQDVQTFTALALKRKQFLEAQRAKANNAKPKIIQRLVQCCLLNGGVFLTSLIFFSYGLLPGLQIVLRQFCGGHAPNIWTWLEPLLNGIFSVLWVLPVFILTRVVNCFWFLDIADQAYRHFRGRPQALPSMKRFIVDSIFSYSVQIIFLVQSHIVYIFPHMYFFTDVIGLTQISVLYSLYIFEYRWCNQGKEFLYRLNALEENWPYFVGFGLPLTIITWMPASRLVSGCLFAILFPLFIISAMEASSTPRRVTPLNLFRPSLWVNHQIFNRYVSSVSQQVKANRALAAPPPAPAPAPGRTSRVRATRF